VSDVIPGNLLLKICSLLKSLKPSIKITVLRGGKNLYKF